MQVIESAKQDGIGALDKICQRRNAIELLEVVFFGRVKQADQFIRRVLLQIGEKSLHSLLAACNTDLYF